jgi:hypothetical protein
VVLMKISRLYREHTYRFLHGARKSHGDVILNESLKLDKDNVCA